MSILTGLIGAGRAQEAAVMSNGHILVVDDEAEVRDLLEEYLGKQGFRISTAESVSAARILLTGMSDDDRAVSAIDAVILDLRMPGEDGLVLARELRIQGNVAIIMLTASGETIDRVVGLEIGADDYMAKPFDPRELLARIRSVLRRTRLEPQEFVRHPEPDGISKVATSRSVSFGRCLLDLDARRLFAPDGTEVSITAMQFDLMETFLNHPNRVLSRDQLLELAHKRGDDPFDRSIDIRIARLRRKIEECPERPQTIKTVHGVGYIYVPVG
jgi:DNA-binding response OmpR family regulator